MLNKCVSKEWMWSLHNIQVLCCFFLSSLISLYPSPYPAPPIPNPPPQNTHFLFQKYYTVYRLWNPSNSLGLHLCMYGFLCMACFLTTLQPLNHLLAKAEGVCIYIVWSMGSETRLPDFKFQLWLLAMRPQANYLTSLGFYFPMYKIELIKIPT